TTARSCMTRCPIVRSWPPISSSSSAATPRLQMPAARASDRGRSAWLRATLSAGRRGGMTEDDFDVERLRLRPEDIAAYVGKAGAAAPRARRQDQFVIVPIAWADQLKAARYTSTYRLAHDLLHQHWKNGGQAIALTNVVSLKNAGVSRGQKWRALSELE